MSSVPTGGNTFKNILIGVVTTVVAYVIVHFLFDSKSSEKKKKATIDGWELLTRYEESSSLNYYSAYCDNTDLGEQLEAVIYEKEQLAKNYEIIKNKPEIDEDLASFASRAIGLTIENKKILESYLAELRATRTDLSEKAVQNDSVVGVISTRYSEKIERARKRDEESLQTTMKVLLDRYGDVFKLPNTEGQEYAEDDFVGAWKEASIDKHFKIKADNTFVMTADGNDYPGKWTYINKTIEMVFDDGSGNIKFHIKKFNPKFFIYTLNTEDTERQACKQE
jgi:hypothetical protein